MTGMILQFYGLVYLFGQFFPIVSQSMQDTPIIGDFLKIQMVEDFFANFGGGNSRRAPVWARKNLGSEWFLRVSKKDRMWDRRSSQPLQKGIVFFSKTKGKYMINTNDSILVKNNTYKSMFFFMNSLYCKKKHRCDPKLVRIWGHSDQISKSQRYSKLLGLLSSLSLFDVPFLMRLTTCSYGFYSWSLGYYDLRWEALSNCEKLRYEMATYPSYLGI